MDIRKNVPARQVSSWKARLAQRIRKLGSYAALVLILPGGSLIALCVWMLRHRVWLAARTRRALTGLLAFCASLIFPR